jgi:hypothetical protein
MGLYLEFNTRPCSKVILLKIQAQDIYRCCDSEHLPLRLLKFLASVLCRELKLGILYELGACPVAQSNLVGLDKVFNYRSWELYLPDLSRSLQVFKSPYCLHLVSYGRKS